MTSPEEYAQATAERVLGNPLGRHLGMTVIEATPERLVAGLTFSADNTTAGDQVHGGAISSLIDAAATAVAWAGVDLDSPPSFGTTVTLEVRFMAPARGCDLVATATVPRRGRSICFCHVEVTDPDGNRIAQGDCVYKLGYPRS